MPSESPIPAAAPRALELACAVVVRCPLGALAELTVRHGEDLARLEALLRFHAPEGAPEEALVAQLLERSERVVIDRHTTGRRVYVTGLAGGVAWIGAFGREVVRAAAAAGFAGGRA